MDQLSSYLPPSEGFLPKWLLLVEHAVHHFIIANASQISVVSVGNSIQAYAQPTYAQRVYTGSKSIKGTPVNGLSSRTFGTWTLLSSVIRLYAAYYTSDPLIYQLAMWTYGIALFHFISELVVFKSTSLAPGSIAPLIVASSTFTWMFLQKDFYVE